MAQPKNHIREFIFSFCYRLSLFIPAARLYICAPGVDFTSFLTSYYDNW